MALSQTYTFKLPTTRTEPVVCDTILTQFSNLDIKTMTGSYWGNTSQWLCDLEARKPDSVVFDSGYVTVTFKLVPPLKPIKCAYILAPE